MPDQETQKALFSLLRLGLWESAQNEAMPFLSDSQWADVYQAARMHTVEGIVFDGVQRMPENLLPPRELLLKWTVRVDQIERHNIQMAACIKSQLHWYQEAGIHPALLKGQGVAACYEIPAHRISGDIDWYFGGENDYRRANELIRTKGLDLSYDAGFSTAYKWQGIVVEHHKRMFDLHNPFCFSYLAQLQKKYHETQLKVAVQGNLLTLPAPILMMLQVNAHILKHLLAFGLGIRQLCDAARVYYAHRLSVNGQQLKEIYKKLGILEWIHLLHAVLVKYIGLQPEHLPFALPQHINADWMMEEIWRSGNFGYFDSRYNLKGAKAGTDKKHSGRRVSRNLIKYFKYAPMEVFSFPVLQFISKFAAK
jgi:hypothetical protein